MALFPDYATSAQLKAQLRIEDTADDLEIARAVTAASRAIDHACNRQFGLNGSAVARVYAGDCTRIDGRPAIAIFDVMTTSGLVVKIDQGDDGTHETTLTLNTDFHLWPYNAGGDLKPWTHIVFTAQAQAYPSGVPQEVQVTANWGWTTVPTIVEQACLIQASRFFVRRDSTYGVAGSPEVGSEVRLLDRLDSDVAMMLRAVKRPWGAV